MLATRSMRRASEQGNYFEATTGGFVRGTCWTTSPRRDSVKCLISALTYMLFISSSCAVDLSYSIDLLLASTSDVRPSRLVALQGLAFDIVSS